MKDTTKNFMTHTELELMKRSIKKGQLSIFRIGLCFFCKSEVLKEKKFCSLSCKNNYQNLPEKDRLKRILKRKVPK